MSVSVPVSYGELIDKITILEIKSEKITSESALVNINKELSELRKHEPSGVGDLKIKLKAINEEIWDIEDSLHENEEDQKFDENFVGLARSAYTTNDKRYILKQAINKRLNSYLVEEKSYSYKD
jgi:hypothetical protein